MVFDYALWRNNGFGFHLTNLFSHMMSVLMLYLVLTELRLRLGNPDDSAASPPVDLAAKTWPLCSAALFALYPLHPEAVSWITGRVDTIVTMFCFASFWLYLKGRRTGSTTSIIASLVFFACALMSKEMAIIEPAVLLALEFLVLSPSSTVKARLLATRPFWLTLAGYFLIRRFALGTFIGGYDDSLQSDSTSNLLVAWPHALKMIFVPFNSDLFGSRCLQKTLWTVAFVGAAVLAICKSISEKTLRPLGLFLPVWFILALVPVFKLLNIGGDLEGSRLAYLATGPLCAFLCFGLLPSSKVGAFANTKALLAKVIIFGLLSLSYLALVKNNEPWREAGLQSQAILAGLDRLYSNATSNPPTYLLELPDTVHGAYLIRNAIDGMTKPPQISREAKRCFVLNNFDLVFPFGLSKNVIEDKSSQARAFIWNYDKKRFEPYALPSRTDPLEGTWSKDQLKALVVNTPTDNRRLTFRLRGLPCWRSEFVVFRLVNGKSPEEFSDLSLNYTNDLCPLFNRRNRVPCIVSVVDGKPEVTFRLHGEIDWVFGNSSHELTILSSKPIDFAVDQLRLEGPEKHLPQLSISQTENLNKNGFVNLSTQARTAQICYDVRDLIGAVGVQLEATKPGKFFPVHNSPTASRDLGFVQSYPSNQGKLTLGKDEFPKDGIYEVRIRAVDDKDRPIGFASDHLLVNVSD